MEQKQIGQADGDSITAFLFYTNQQPDVWVSAMEYIEESFGFFSEKIGPYPYDQISVVEGPYANWSGMEYPMITIIPPDYYNVSLHSTIAHEVGHNWFQGVLGFNERLHPWLDEGLTSYYEDRFIEGRYSRHRSFLLPDAVLGKSKLSDSEATYFVPCPE